MVAQGIQRAHFETSHLQYNDENALSYTISLALYAAREIFIPFTENWQVEKDLQIWSLFRKKQFAEKPALVVELKWDKSAESAIKQIKDKKYFESVYTQQNGVLVESALREIKTAAEKAVFYHSEKRRKQRGSGAYIRG